MSRPRAAPDMMYPSLWLGLDRGKLAQTDNRSWTPNKATNATRLDFSKQRWEGREREKKKKAKREVSIWKTLSARVFSEHFFFFLLLVIIFNIKSY